MDVQDQLLTSLDDTTANSIADNPDPVPSSEYHPCSVWGIRAALVGEDMKMAYQKDMHCLVRQCQSHTLEHVLSIGRGPPN